MPGILTAFLILCAAAIILCLAKLRASWRRARTLMRDVTRDPHGVDGDTIARVRHWQRRLDAEQRMLPGWTPADDEIRQWLKDGEQRG